LDEHPNNPETSLKIPATEQSVQLLQYLKEIPEAENAVKDQGSKLPEAQARWEKELEAKPPKPAEPEGLLSHFSLDETLAGVNVIGPIKQAAYRDKSNPPACVDGKLGRAGRFDGEGNYIS